MRLLELPENITNPSSIERMFWGIPVIGIDRRAFSLLRKIQSERTMNIDSLWPDDTIFQGIKKYFDGVLREDFEWVNKYFHPQDRMDALFFYPYSGAVSDGVHFEILNKFPQLEDINIGNMTYFDLVKFILL